MEQVTTLQTGELFAGAGGLGLGFVLAQSPAVHFVPIFSIDNDKHSINTYKHNAQWLVEKAPELLPSLPGIFLRDVEKLNIKALIRLFHLEERNLDLLLAGPPCQGYSTANRQGKKLHKDKQNRLVKIFLDKLEALEPKMFLMENVQGLRWTEPTEEMDHDIRQGSLFIEGQAEKSLTSNVQSFVIQKARKLGYHLWYSTLDAADFGVPQHRYRFLLFGVRNDIVSDDNQVNLTPYLERLKTQEPITVGQAIGDLPSLSNGEIWKGESYHPRNEPYIMTMRRFMANGDLFDHRTTKHQDYVIERYKKIPEGGNWESIKDMMGNYTKIDNTHSNIYRRLLADKPAITISHYRKSMIIHPLQDRGLSMREACRLQSFPDWFRFQGPMDKQQQQLANAVPPLMASAVARAIAECWSKIVMRRPEQQEPSL